VTDAVYDVHILEEASGRLIYAARDSGLYRSTDDGISWMWLYDSLPTRVSHATTAVVAHGQTYVAAAINGGILTTYDAARTWQFASLTRPSPFVTALVLSSHIAHGRLLLAATLQDGMFRSADHGVSWSPYNYGLWDATVFALAASPDGLFYAGTNSGVFVSVNGGRAWHETAFPSVGAVMRLACAAGGAVFAATEAGELYFSGDSGQHWQQMPTAWQHRTGDPPRLRVHPRDGRTLHVETGDQIWVTTTLGKPWQSQPLPNWTLRLEAWSGSPYAQHSSSI
jgi:photosystem II stability/assembly factor-like uncharacterized protein